MSDQSKSYVKICTAGLVVIAALGALIYGHHVETATAEQADQYHNKVRTARLSYSRKKDKVTHELFNNATRSKDPIIRAIAINGHENSTVQKPFLKFFNVLYNWDNHSQYINRAKRLRSVATSRVLSNRHVFDKDKDSSGDSVIEAEELHSAFNDLDLYVTKADGSTINVIAVAKYNAWHSGTDTDNQGTGETWFNMTYNTGQKKITSMSKIVNIPNVNNQNNSND